tara:strand:- start:4599 stop:5474 length:876 start_codon:yes stop_codon:yes gene_type:complete
MLGTEVVEALDNDLNSIVAAMSSDNVEEMMKLTGQGGAVTEKVGLPRLNINYDQETDDGHNLTRGDWKMFLDGQFIYAKEVKLRALLRTYEYSVWDSEANEGKGGFSCKSVQKTSFGGEFPDTQGGNKCGRLSRDEEEALDKDDVRYLNSRAVVCNQVIYGRISGSFHTPDGTPVEVVDEPVIAYFKRSGFRPIADFIQSLTKQNKLMAQTNILLRTSRQKKGSVTFWTPLPTFDSTVAITDDDKELLGTFAETVKAHNENVMNEYREASKLMSDDSDIDLAADFKDANAA